MFIAIFALNDFNLNFTTTVGVLLSITGALLFSIKSMIENVKRLDTIKVDKKD